ncbi:hypothetical protein JHK87_017956 [Glycine soja]|nr:hypothetical protein JHK87_017956 [Glycine soja]
MQGRFYGTYDLDSGCQGGVNVPPFWATIHPPFHMTPEDKFFYRNDTANFPYLAYHYYCVPDNAKHLEQPVSTCDPNNNPKAQEIVQLLSDPIWDACDYPTKKGDGCGLGIQGFGNLMLDPGTPPAKRIWTSIDTQTEIFVSAQDEVA